MFWNHFCFRHSNLLRAWNVLTYTFQMYSLFFSFSIESFCIIGTCKNIIIYNWIANRSFVLFFTHLFLCLFWIPNKKDPDSFHSNVFFLLLFCYVNVHTKIFNVISNLQNLIFFYSSWNDHFLQHLGYLHPCKYDPYYSAYVNVCWFYLNEQNNMRDNVSSVTK